MKLLPIPKKSEVTSDPPVRETRIEDQTNDWAKANGWFVAKFVSPGQRGVPDRMYIRSGIVVFIEFKRKDAEPKRHQYNKHDEMRRHGAYVHWADNHEDAIRILASYHL
ncbi:endonuclease [Burkholderia phage BcepNazgul]|uniref:Conserved phage protein n=1 Tax=Burkholderia phage BcepNazgul TaxID=242861 RepID=Q6UYH3_9CAUD|nr:endonuclease [Burkholderia phage BcepNazgul]AAQ63368.2 conserved phage protein [Burkholderia phage BcepNazgul]